MSTTVQRSIRLTGFDSTFLNRTTGSNGEIFYDQTNKTLRIMDGRIRGGNPLAAGAIVSDTPPTQPQQGQLWIKASTGTVYIWYIDVLGGQWIQPETRPIGVLESAEPQLQLASIEELGILRVDGTTIEIDEDGVISTNPSLDFNNPTFLGISTSYVNSSIFNTLIGASGVVIHNVATAGTTFYHANTANNFTANFTNMPTTNNQSTTLTLIIEQNTIPYIANAVQINGSAISIGWAGGEIPTGTANNIDIVTFIALRINNEWSVAGSLASQGEI
jgi:hypothetical protein